MTRTSRARTSPTILDVAASAGVSPATAARALGGYGSVRPSTAEKVTSAAQALGYQANGIARSMITGRTMTLGVVVGDIENEFFSRVVRGFADTARAAGFATIMANTDERLDLERSAVRMFLERRVDGLLVAPASMYDGDHLKAAREAGVPLVLVDRRVRRSGLDTVLIDSVTAAREAVAELVAQGHRRIGLVTGAGVGEPDVDGGDPPVSTSVDRLQGYREALEAAGIAYDPTLVRPGDFHLEAARVRVTELLSATPRPTAVFATDGILALGTLLAIRDVGLRCPHDVSVVGFDDPAWASVVDPPLSVMAQPANELGGLAAEQLLARLGGDAARPRTRMLQAVWRGRESIAPPA
jgi:LacI family transcriptional regulator